MRLEPLYRLRFVYPMSWMVGLEGGWEQHLFLAEGDCEGSISGRFRGLNFPQRRTAEGPFRPDIRAVIETDDDAVIMSSCTDTAAPIQLVDGRSSARSSTSATASIIVGSTMSYASAWGRSAHPLIRTGKALTS